ncbi:hypothetical protein PHMEG_0004001 [Phytophthora megakarya]|uniref:Uncharacterized protein n=1 Tax=Phytophthora megakarya TaxID=4795 RepID=A0A225WUZ9_9STRA|nr:hypothetical protein PHMEG_0004001 [Phytophthora megakarya]
MMNDQEGEFQRDPRHVYTNPKEPDICPILPWEIYFAVFGFNSKSALFPGSNYKVLLKAIGIASVATELKNSGRLPSGYEPHSARAGSSTGLGWDMPEAQDTYARYEAACDRVVGRLVAGLPYETPVFAGLPPFFEKLDETV